MSPTGRLSSLDISRQYAMPTAYQEDYSAGDMAYSPPRAPYSASDDRQLPQYPALSQQPGMRSPPRKPVASRVTAATAQPQQGPPPPPPHRIRPPSPPRHHYQSPNAPDRSAFGSAAASGDMPGTTHADFHGSDSQALRDIDNLYDGRLMSPSPEPRPFSHTPAFAQPKTVHRPTDSQSSAAPLRYHAAAMPMTSSAASQPDWNTMAASDTSGYGYSHDRNASQGQTSHLNPYDTYVDPNDIADDGDDGFDETPRSRRPLFGGAVAGAATAGAGIRNAFASRNASGSYGQLAGGGRGGDAEKSEWLQSQTGRTNRSKYLLGGLGILIVCGIIAGVVAGVILTEPGTDKTGKAQSDPSGDYTLQSSEVQAVMGNSNLHKVFPGIDYTPLNAQYPACLTVPPNQDNITLDVAVLSQLSPAIRLYGTDCNQTQMVLTAIDRLDMSDTIKVWLGVWLATNATTNARQMNQMYEILDKYPTERFAGVIVGNEVLFREDMTAAELGDILLDVKSKFKSKGIDLPVSTSDIGSAWTASIAADSDIVMANVHPFFAGVKPNVAAAWTWDFWQENDVALAGAADGSYPKSIISETGWPTEGGNDCGTGKKCPTTTEGAIAGIDEMNTFMEGWVCDSLANGTTYFWFEAFDEPWTVIFDDPKTGDYWEPHWGLMDVNRNLKAGVKIPDCGGKTIDRFY